MIELAWDYLEARGHKNVRATHETTFEITRESYVTPRGDCIIACSSSKSVLDLNDDLKRVLRHDDSIVVIVLDCCGIVDYVVARGSSRLSLTDDRRIIVRRSSYVDAATLAVRSDKAARDLDRELVKRLREGELLRVWILALRPAR